MEDSEFGNLETPRKASIAAIESLNADGRIINQQLISDTFNKYFLSIAEKMSTPIIIIIKLTHMYIIPTLTMLIAPYNICHKFIIQDTQKLNENL
jgi:hypothetical protein